MALTEFVGAVILEVDGLEIECSKVSPKINTGRKMVKTMNSKKRVAGYCEGVKTIEMTVTVPIPVDGSAEPDWAEMVDAKLVVYPISGNGARTAYTGCIVTEVSESFEFENEASRDLTIEAQDVVKE